MNLFGTTLSSTIRMFRRIMRETIQALYGNRDITPSYVFRKRYRMHNQRVKSFVPPSKLLVYNVKQGWKPFCDFLGCESPNVGLQVPA